MFSGNKLILFSIWIVYSILSFLVVCYHEPGCDEANYWLVSRDVPVTELLPMLKSWSHPALWFVLIMPFAKLGFPFFTGGVVHWLLMVITAAAFLFKSPFATSFKVLFLFSYYMMFEYVAEIRDYNLTVFFLFMIAAIYPKRFENKLFFSLLVFLLFNSNIHSFGAAVGLTIAFALDSYSQNKIKETILPLSIMISGCAALTIPLFYFRDIPFNLLVNSRWLPPFDFTSAWAVLTSIQNAFIPWSKYEEVTTGLLFFIFFVFLLSTFVNRKQVLIFLVASSGWLFYLFSTKNIGLLRHDGLLLIFIIFSLWIQQYYSAKETFVSKFISRFINYSQADRVVKLCIASCLMVSVAYGARTLQKEFKYAYAGAKETGQFIANSISAREIACYTSTYNASAVAPYIPGVKLWLIDLKDYRTYIHPDRNDFFAKTISEEEIFKRCEEKYGNTSTYFLLLNTPLSKDHAPNYSAQLIYKNSIPIWADTGSTYFIYKISILNG